MTITLDNDQLDTHLLYFTIRPLQYSTCFKHYMLIIRRLILKVLEFFDYKKVIRIISKVGRHDSCRNLLTDLNYFHCLVCIYMRLCVV